ncbi:molybdopterin cofactor-binding domain-containing protein [Aurantimonas sp. HBX-1]|uniref:molybdopterin cofactor-binding domain-containing protein n=1 Tax=Aurantimonas sp. HBX-1 TaxID=2906072 RepID=UPI001F3CF3DF|nr:molybdopterin cofactor-binding domain-containing protein [Aurantimonas sp. HBX-1]UIJ73416.1 molybdopterin-dependent oxidoreductase [Aurantimonas sp. HBX-1]
MSGDYGRILVFRDNGGGPEVFLSFDTSGVAIGFNGHVDLGTGIETALSQIVAEELDLPLDRVRMVLGDTARTPNQGPTIASETIQITAVPLRHAAAQIRRELSLRGARRLNAPASRVTLSDGSVRWKDTAASFESLIAGEDVALRLDLDAPVKDPENYAIVGRSAARVDLPAKVTGSHPFIHDVFVDGMVHGHVVRPPYQGRDSGAFIARSLVAFDEAAVRDMPGFLAVVRRGDFLGVVAERADQAEAIAETLPVEWLMPPELPEMASLAETIRGQPATPRTCDATGDFSAGIGQCDVRLTRSYVWPYHLHGSIGPSCAIADWNSGEPIVWSGSQNPHMLRADLANLMELDEARIDIRRYQAAGCYGRNCADDVCGDALLLSHAVGRPVRVQLTRAQEHLWEPKGAAQVMDVEGGLKDGAFHAYSLDSWYPSNRGPNLALLLTGRVSPEPRPADMGDRTIVPPYRIAHKAITVHDMAPIVRAAWMRGVSALPNTFAHESFVDELAYEAGRDPVAFRLAHVDDPRTAHLIRESAEKGGWEARSGPRKRREGRMAYGQGFAFATYVHGTFPGTAAAASAWICDVAVDMVTGEVQLTRVFVGQDQGLVINPDGVRHQIHGNVNQTASRVLKEELSFDEITVTAKSWASYPLQTFPETPAIETMLIERAGDPALGVGESAAVPAAAAIANAIFDATGIRMREAPFTPEKMRAALAVAGSGPTALVAGPGAEASWRDRLVAKGFGSKASGAKGIGLAALLGGSLTAGALALPIHRAIPPTAAPPAASFSAELLAKGRQVFAAGNCSDCHTVPGGPPNAGGLAVETPFGTIYTSNITPDPGTGLGNWSYEAFERAMRKGVSRDGSNLYPAFPYASFARMSGDDMFALYAYLQTLEPVHQETPQAEMAVPFNLRPLNAGWNALYLGSGPLAAVAERSPEWNRGRYLVEATGHCGACHSPRNALGAEKGGEAALSGAPVKGWYAPPIAGPGAASFGWDEPSFYEYLRTGVAGELAAAAGPMADVVANLQELPDTDIRAMAIYLASLATDGAGGADGDLRPSDDLGDAAAGRAATPVPDATHRLFESACAVCHEPAVGNLATAAQVPLWRSPAVRSGDDEALRTVIREGIEAPLSLKTRDMPGFGKELTSGQIDALAAYVRTRYGAAPR